jgi:hypothetical protein
VTKDELSNLPDGAFVTGTQSGMHFWGYYSKGKTNANSSTGNRLFASWLQVIQRAVDEKSRIDDCPHCNWAGAWTCGNAAVAVEEPKKERYLSPFSGKWV